MYAQLVFCLLSPCPVPLLPYLPCEYKTNSFLHTLFPSPFLSILLSLALFFCFLSLTHSLSLPPSCPSPKMKVTAVIVSAFAACAVAAGDVTPQPVPVTVDAGHRGELGDSCGLCVLSCVRLGEGLHASVADDAVAACKLGVCEPLVCRLLHPIYPKFALCKGFLFTDIINYTVPE